MEQVPRSFTPNSCGEPFGEREFCHLIGCGLRLLSFDVGVSLIGAIGGIRLKRRVDDRLRELAAVSGEQADHGVRIRTSCMDDAGIFKPIH